MDQTGSDTRSLMMRVNPVPMTAQMAVYLMARAGIPDADGICADLGIYRERVMPKGAELTGDILLGNILVVESKYRTMLRIIEASGEKVCVDLPSGYTPKAIHLTRAGRRFVGLDLPVVASDANAVILPRVAEGAQASFHGVDATNWESLRDALADVEGEICLSTEGMMMYFNESEASVVVDNICRLLEEHGGCWLTPDPEIGLHFLRTFQALGPDAMSQLMSTRAAAQESSDLAAITNSLLIAPTDVEEGTRRALSFLADHHLQVERINMGEWLAPLTSYAMLTDEQVSAFKKAMDGCFCWKMTVARGAERTFESGRSFRCSCRREGGRLAYSVVGRLDSISSPELLASFEEGQRESEMRSVLVDCQGLDYISSAGLRVLLLMHKACPDGLKLTNVGAAVREILEETAFDEFFSCEDSGQ